MLCAVFFKRNECMETKNEILAEGHSDCQASGVDGALNLPSPARGGQIKFYIGHLFERNGDFTYNNTQLFQTDGDPYGFLDGVASSWYGEENDIQAKENDGYYFDCGAVFVRADRFQEVSAEDYAVLTKYKGFIA